MWYGVKGLTKKLSSFCPPRQTNWQVQHAVLSPELQQLPTELQDKHDNWEGRGSEVIMDCSRSQKMAKVPWVAQMSAGFMKCHPESFKAAGQVCWHSNVCVNYISVLFFSLCVQREEIMSVGGAPPLPSSEWTHILWCQTILDFYCCVVLGLRWCHSATWL